MIVSPDESDYLQQKPHRFRIYGSHRTFFFKNLCRTRPHFYIMLRTQEKLGGEDIVEDLIFIFEDGL